MSRAITSHLLESLVNGDRSAVDSLPLAGKLLLLQWLHSALSADISDLGSRFAPLAQSFPSGSGLTVSGAPQAHTAWTEPTSPPLGGMGDRFRRGLNIPPAETPPLAEDGIA